MIDAGAGVFFGPTLGKLIANLKASGYQPEQVDEIYITHMHSDHVGGLVDGDKIAFPNAVVRADRRDADFWLSKANMDTAPKEAKPVFEGAMASINPYIAAGNSSRSTATPILYQASPPFLLTATHRATRSTWSKAKANDWCYGGDLMHVAAVQFAEPSVTIRFDTDSKAAAAQRKKQYADAAKRGTGSRPRTCRFPALAICALTARVTTGCLPTTRRYVDPRSALTTSVVSAVPSRLAYLDRVVPHARFAVVVPHLHPVFAGNQVRGDARVSVNARIVVFGN